MSVMGMHEIEMHRIRMNRMGINEMGCYSYIKIFISRIYIEFKVNY